MTQFLLLGPAPTPAQNYLGGNLGYVHYYNSELPWLNVLHQAGGWSTRNSSNGETNEEGYLQLDANGIPTSMTASPTPPGGQKFTQLLLLLLNGLPTPAGASYPYPPGDGPGGTYTFTLQGSGTVQFTGDFGLITGVSNPTYLSGVGTQNLVSTLPPGVTATATVALATPTASPGMQIILKATDPSNVGNYLMPLGTVQTSLQPLWAAGGPNSILHPNFIASVNNLSGLRFKDQQLTDSDWMQISVVGGSIPAGSTSTTMYASGVYYNWPYATQTRKVYFTDGEIRTAAFTLGSPVVDWSADPAGGLTNTVTGTYVNDSFFYCQFCIFWHDNFANRSLPSNMSWSTVMGVPLEVICAVSNLLEVDCYSNFSCTVTDADVASIANLMMSGTGMQAGWAPLAAPLLWRPEWANEAWNGGYMPLHFAGSWGGQLWPTQTPGGGNGQWAGNYRGYRTAVIAELISAAVGETLFERVYPVLNCQAASAGGDASVPMNTPYWTSTIDGYIGPAKSHPIKHIAIAPYMGNGLPSVATGGSPDWSDAEAIVASGGDGGLTAFFQTFSGQSTIAGNLSSIPVGGWLQQTLGWIEGWAAAMALYPGVTLIGYEGGTQFSSSGANSGNPTLAANWLAMLVAAESDPRMQTVYAAWLNNWKNTVGAGQANALHYLWCCAPCTQYGDEGVLQSTMQTIVPLTAAPPKFRAVQNYIAA